MWNTDLQQIVLVDELLDVTKRFVLRNGARDVLGRKGRHRIHDGMTREVAHGRTQQHGCPFPTQVVERARREHRIEEIMIVERVAPDGNVKHQVQNFMRRNLLKKPQKMRLGDPGLAVRDRRLEGVGRRRHAAIARRERFDIHHQGRPHRRRMHMLVGERDALHDG